MGAFSPVRKVVPIIAEVRHVDSGRSLQSHLTIGIFYSIEISTLVIYKLRQLNPAAVTAVKGSFGLGGGHVAAGIAKAGPISSGWPP